MRSKDRSANQYEWLRGQLEDYVDFREYTKNGRVTVIRIQHRGDCLPPKKPLVNGFHHKMNRKFRQR